MVEGSLAATEVTNEGVDSLAGSQAVADVRSGVL